jgi:predicted metal-dependent hydrolase
LALRCVDPIPPPTELPERFCGRPFPPYRFVPGRCPHPHRDPEGHGVGVDPSTPANEAWRYGVDLFNARFYWEAHEAWETVWSVAERGSSAYYATKGMIQITASLLTLYMCRTDASRHLASRGAELLERAMASSRKFRQLELEVVARMARERVVEPPELPELDQAAFVITLER